MIKGLPVSSRHLKGEAPVNTAILLLGTFIPMLAASMFYINAHSTARGRTQTPTNEESGQD